MEEEEEGGRWGGREVADAIAVAVADDIGEWRW